MVLRHDQTPHVSEQILCRRRAHLAPIARTAPTTHRPPRRGERANPLEVVGEGSRAVTEFDIELSGPVKRILRSGAAGYVLSDSIDELAAKITARPHGPGSESEPAAVNELTSASTVDDLVAAFLRESVEYSTRRQRNVA
jgi:hypothetical protein